LKLSHPTTGYDEVKEEPIIPVKQCKQCEKPLEPNTDEKINYFTITPINLVTYIKDTYYLCRSCFNDLITPVCTECGSENIKKEYVNELDVIPEVISFCLDCGLILNKYKPNTKSWKEKRDYTNNPHDYKDLL